MDFVDVAGVRIAYERYGRGRPLVLVGGTGMPMGTWQLSGARDALAGAGFEVVTYAARGVAPSDAPPAPYTVEELAGDLAGLMDALDIRDAAVVGYSLGSFTAESLARSRPDLVRSAVLMAGAGPLSAVLETVLEAEAELIALTGHLPAAFMRFQTLVTILAPAVLRDDQSQARLWKELVGGQEAAWASPEGAAGQSSAADRWARDEGRMAALAGISVPVLVLSFEHDLYFPPHAGEEAAEALPRGRFAMVPGAAHGGLITHPAETLKVLTAFLTDD